MGSLFSTEKSGIDESSPWLIEEGIPYSNALNKSNTCAEQLVRTQKLSELSELSVESDGSTSTSSSGPSGITRGTVLLNSFTPVKVLGKGSHGKVILVRHNSNSNFYAMKEFRKQNVIARKQVSQTMQELELHKRLSKEQNPSPYIVSLRYAFHTRQRLYMIFDFCSGGELYYHLGQRGRVPEVLARFYASQIALALEYLHALDIIYHDLKPENLVLDCQGNIKLIDFGLCKTRDMVEQNLLTMCGTTEYLAPEMLNPSNAVEIGPGVDWWAFGMVLYEMLTGLPPWYSYDKNEIVSGILYRHLKLPKYLSKPTQSILLGLLNKNSKQRLGSSGSDEVLEHPFFESMDWKLLRSGKAKSPFTPPKSEVEELQNFDKNFTSMNLDPEIHPLTPFESDAFKGFYFNHEEYTNRG